MNGVAAAESARFSAEQRRLRAGDDVMLRIARGSDTIESRLKLDAVPLEMVQGATAEYSALRSPLGYSLRMVVNRPERNAGARLPAILFIPWLSCDPVEKPSPGTDGFAHTLRGIAAESGVMLVRVEKPGVGDSEGPPCRDGSLHAELTAYRAALQAIRARGDVDTTRLFLLGGSLGGGIAPILAAESPRGIAGVISLGGFTKTWIEHMIELERRRLELSGKSPGDINAAMGGFARFYADYLIGAQTPAAVLARHPDLRDIWYDEPEHQYGRRASYYHEVQRLNVEAAWAKLAELGIPGLVVWGEYDWIMSRADQQLAVDILNRKSAGSGTLAVLAGVDHGLMKYASLRAGFADESPTYDGAPHRVINDWVRGRLARAQR